MPNKALFLDRDGVICEATPRGIYLLKTEQFHLLNGIEKLIKNAKIKGYKVIVVTNQASIGKGLLTIENLGKIHLKMRELLGDVFDEIYYCPHKKEDKCDCRKPNIGMILNAKKKYNIDLNKSFIVGDSDKDINAGISAGVKTIFLKNEFNKEELKLCNPNFVVNSLEDIEKLI